MLTVYLTRQIAGCVGASDDGAGVLRLAFSDGTSRPPTASEVLAAAQAAAIAANRAEAERRLFARWPVGKQLSINAGLYPDAVKELRDAHADAVIAAENAAADAIDACTAVEQVAAVVVNWPSLA